MATSTLEQINETLDRVAMDLVALKEREEEHVRAQAEREEQYARERAEREAQYARAQAERDRRDADFKAMMGNFVRNAGEAHEEFFYQSLRRVKRLGDIVIDRIEKNVHTANGRAEIDLIWFNRTSAGIIEVKQKAHPDDVDDLIARKVSAAKRAYPDYEQFYFGIATMVSNAALAQKAREAGIFLLTQGGEHLEVVNDHVRAF